MKRSKVSVAMATFNGARFLEAQLGSIAAQTRVPDELVVGDDGSDDRTAELIAEFSRKHRIEVQFTRNEVRLGSTQNFASCLQRCRGDVILLTDQDDVWYPSRVERTLQVLEEHPGAAYVFSDADLIDERGDPLPGRLCRGRLSATRRLALHAAPWR
jgi:glycosyltransferase involved in cell wall biosynthesis